ncbi:hypothetical protein R1sor_009810 [Riccia sorocarpa]|uniref:Uncharacterized protein n=1 Tax=Riccia sorocarpa TaxID=122646 RepID=A0ABD3I295_9MARC
MNHTPFHMEYGVEALGSMEFMIPTLKIATEYNLNPEEMVQGVDGMKRLYKMRVSKVSYAWKDYAMSLYRMGSFLKHNPKAKDVSSNKDICHGDGTSGRRKRLFKEKSFREKYRYRMEASSSSSSSLRNYPDVDFYNISLIGIVEPETQISVEDYCKSRDEDQISVLPKEGNFDGDSNSSLVKKKIETKKILLTQGGMARRSPKRMINTKKYLPEKKAYHGLLLPINVLFNGWLFHEEEYLVTNGGSGRNYDEYCIPGSNDSRWTYGLTGVSELEAVGNREQLKTLTEPDNKSRGTLETRRVNEDEEGVDTG